MLTSDPVQVGRALARRAMRGQGLLAAVQAACCAELLQLGRQAALRLRPGHRQGVLAAVHAACPTEAAPCAPSITASPTDVIPPPPLLPTLHDVEVPHFFCPVLTCLLGVAAESLGDDTMHHTERGRTASMASTVLCNMVQTAFQAQPDAVMRISDRLLWQSMYSLQQE